ncbi:MAG: hypothetical protein COT92_01325 [Candidatus Doudnabacteria bacterium CG10_big_fil_rev_8_21_14_0_10_42_18]|uniref:Uncharacterized protein n=1 Tax=Candidatus Doudnabacteria bacterium CG10_big_fil_rev_8_21_14_0_10_42_18 TaxID=1974552 RepID=A0A2H0VDF3_9BACT|nr:MAG: hypothetical protein COT92_01325 [Candidatus Doudnabacteria bacterium CG10_big_fil_rev_8_21_14_0_10_42_18]
METNKKTIIQLAIIAVGFLGSGIVLYKGLFGGAGNEHPAALIGALGELVQEPGSSEISQSGQILPYGTGLDFEVLDRVNQEYNTVLYPRLNPVLEVGILEDELVVPPVKPGNNE